MTGSAAPEVAAAPFEIRVHPKREEVHVQPVGELDLSTSPRLDAQILELVDRDFDHVVIDLRKLAFIDVAGMRLLLGLSAAAARDDWRLSLIQGGEAVRRIFALTGTLERLPFRSAY